MFEYKISVELVNLYQNFHLRMLVDKIVIVLVGEHKIAVETTA
jgi:hypothetical protein